MWERFEIVALQSTDKYGLSWRNDGKWKEFQCFHYCWRYQKGVLWDGYYSKMMNTMINKQQTKWEREMIEDCGDWKRCYVEDLWGNSELWIMLLVIGMLFKEWTGNDSRFLRLLKTSDGRDVISLPEMLQNRKKQGCVMKWENDTGISKGNYSWRSQKEWQKYDLNQERIQSEQMKKKEKKESVGGNEVLWERKKQNCQWKQGC